MKIPFLHHDGPSKEMVKKAKKAIESLGSGRRLKKVEKQKLADAQKVVKRAEEIRQKTRRDVGIAGAVALGVAAIGGFALSSSFSAPDPAPAVPVATASASSPKHEKGSKVTPEDSKENEALTDKLIDKVETGMRNFEGVLKGKMAQSRQDPELSKKLLDVFRVAEINIRNPKKNAARLGIESGQRTAQPGNSPWFIYEVNNSVKQGAAIFQPPTRIMGIAPDFDPDNYVDMLVIAHEHGHVMQDNELRGRIQSAEEYEKYLDLYTMGPDGKMNVFVLEEVTAYAYEIEMLDLLLDGELKKSITSGHPLDIDKTMSKLNIKAEDKSRKGPLTLIIELAGAYYSSESSISGDLKRKYSDAFVAIIRRKFGDNVSIFERADLYNLKPYETKK